jgi:hypothetical protein
MVSYNNNFTPQLAGENFSYINVLGGVLLSFI